MKLIVSIVRYVSYPSHSVGKASIKFKAKSKDQDGYRCKHFPSEEN